MEKYVCIKHYISLNGNIEFNKDDIHEANLIGNRYEIKRNDGFLCLMKEEQFIKIFKKQFTFGR